MRGTPQSRERGCGRYGIIPAYAGNTWLVIPWVKCVKDHPRVCGEHTPPASRFAAAPGSSPRMRGTPHPQRSAPCGRGIIPAYAGNTRRSCSMWSHCWDHPRVCGEHRELENTVSVNRGSSPRMRGTLVGGGVGRAVCRIIPAYAGNTR